MTKTTTVIKKYSDRRLYDAAASRYVKLEDIARMIRDGAEVEVVDARTGKDLTRVILTQIVVETARDQDTGLPMQMLRQLVVASDKATHEFIAWYLNGTMELYKKAQENLHTRVSEAKKVFTGPLDFMRNLVASEGEVEELRKRVGELEAQLAHMSKPARRTPKRKRAARE